METIILTETVLELPAGLSASAASDVGTRQNQQDSMRLSAFGGDAAALICDGMGGLASGSDASAAAAAFMERYSDELPQDIPRFLKGCVEALNSAVLKASPGGGTTIVCAVIREGLLYYLSIGDSKLYIIRGGRMESVARTHNYSTFLNRYLENGLISGHEYARRIKHGELLNANNASETIPLDQSAIEKTAPLTPPTKTNPSSDIRLEPISIVGELPSLIDEIEGAKPQGSENDKTVGTYLPMFGVNPVVGWLVCISGEYSGDSFKLKSGRNFIGRGFDMDIALAISIIALLFPYVRFYTFSVFSSLPAYLAPSGVTGIVGVNGAQLSLLNALAFSVLGETMKYLGLWRTLLCAFALLAAIFPTVAALICFFLNLFKSTVRTRASVLIMEIVSFAVNITLMIIAIKGVSAVNDVSILKLSYGAVVAPVVNAACIILSAVLIHQENALAENSVPNSGSSKFGGIACIAGEYIGTVVPLERGDEITIGRDGAACNIVITGDKISRTHCYIKYDLSKGCYVVTDLSSNGTFVRGGSRLVKQQGTELRSGTVLLLGNEENMFRLQ